LPRAAVSFGFELARPRGSGGGKVGKPPLPRRGADVADVPIPLIIPSFSNIGIENRNADAELPPPLEVSASAKHAFSPMLPMLGMPMLPTWAYLINGSIFQTVLISLEALR
jgi:hypothetical protein